MSSLGDRSRSLAEQMGLAPERSAVPAFRDDQSSRLRLRLALACERVLVEQKSEFSNSVPAFVEQFSPLVYGLRDAGLWRPGGAR